MLGSALPACFLVGAAWAGNDGPFAGPAPTAVAEPAPPGVQAPQPQAAVAGVLAARLAGAGETLLVAGQTLPGAALRDSYAPAGFDPVWTGDTGLRPAGAALIAQLQAARAAGMTMFDPLLSAIAAHERAATPEEIGDLELLLSGAMIAVADGLDDLPPSALLAGARQPDPRGFIAAHVPGSFYYWRLRAALPLYRGYVAAGGWPAVPSGPKLEKGMTDPRVAALRWRLLATGELAASGADPQLFDDALEAALRRFQARHGLDPDGKVGPQTLAALNVPAEERLASILLNLDRFRRLSPAMAGRYLYVNIAGMELSLVEQGQVTFHNRVIVGRVDRKTPLLQSVIRRIDFNPTWVVPPKIARIDMLNHLRQDPGYFRSHNVRVYDGWSADAHEIDPDSINWSQYGPGNMPYVLRQDPGPENALGPLKFDFANDYEVYIHGTPVQSLFNLPSRALSSGCVRMEQPVELAAYLLRDNKSWPRSRIDEVVRRATTISVAIDPLPVMLTYQTAWADADGTVEFRPDIYGLDDEARFLSAAGAAPAAPGGGPPAGPGTSARKG